ncbi:MAG: T9SS type A sorting domain-containing protein [bacterium]
MLWNQISYPLNSYSGQTVRLRFRFVSDQSVTAEGWYIDDIAVLVIVGIEETKSSAENPSLKILPNPFTKSAKIRLPIVNEPWQLKIYNVEGKLVRHWEKAQIEPANHIIWDGTDNQDKRIPAGIYFIKMTTMGKNLTQKGILLN